jgi:hypothetical protein
LRKELEPDIEKAEEIVLKVINLITQYDDACDNGNFKKQQLAIEQISDLTQKNISEQDISEYWGYISKEDLAYQFAIPNPSKQDISKSELIELIEKLTSSDEKTFGFYRVLLERSFVHPNPIQLIFNSDELSSDEIAERIVNYKPIIL